MPDTYLSPRTKVARSPIEGRGLFATKRIAKGEIVAIKGGHVMDRAALRRAPARAAREELTYDWAMEANVPARTSYLAEKIAARGRR